MYQYHDFFTLETPDVMANFSAFLFILWLAAKVYKEINDNVL